MSALHWYVCEVVQRARINWEFPNPAFYCRKLILLHAADPDQAVERATKKFGEILYTGWIEGQGETEWHFVRSRVIALLQAQVWDGTVVYSSQWQDGDALVGRHERVSLGSERCENPDDTWFCARALDRSLGDEPGRLMFVARASTEKELIRRVEEAATTNPELKGIRVLDAEDTFDALPEDGSVLFHRLVGGHGHSMYSPNVYW